MNPQRPTIVFDWNCTLLDDIELVLESINTAFVAVEKPAITLEHYQRYCTMPVPNFYCHCGFSESDLAAHLPRIQDMFHDHYEAHVDSQALRKGAGELLQTMTQQGVNSLILSNHIEQPIRGQLQRLGIEQHFSHVLAYADRATQFKHETKGQRLGRFIAEHQLKPDSCIIIGDTEEEIHIARDHGLTSVAISGGFFAVDRLVAQEPHHLVHDLHELHDIIKQRGWLT